MKAALLCVLAGVLLLSLGEAAAMRRLSPRALSETAMALFLLTLTLRDGGAATGRR